MPTKPVDWPLNFTIPGCSQIETHRSTPEQISRTSLSSLNGPLPVVPNLERPKRISLRSGGKSVEPNADYYARAEGALSMKNDNDPKTDTSITSSESCPPQKSYATIFYTASNLLK
jgi:hypothetical protein